MTVDELIQLIRTCNLSQVRAQLQWVFDNDPNGFDEIAWFYKAASEQPK